MENIVEGKKKKLEEEYSDDGIIVGKNVPGSKKDKSFIKEEENSVNIGQFKRETLENGQRVGVLEVDKEMIKNLSVDKEGNVTISLRSDRFKGDDFLNQEVKINLKELEKLNPDANGQVKLLVFEKQAGGQIDEKKELIVMKDTEENRRDLVRNNSSVSYSGEEKILEREKIMDTPVTPNIKFRDVYNQMNEKEKGEIQKKDNNELKTFISDNKKPMTEIEDLIVKKELEAKKRPGNKLYLKDGENKIKVTCVGLDGNGKMVYREDNGKSHELNPFSAGEKIELSANDKNRIHKESFRQGIGSLKLEKEKGIKI